MYFVVEYTNGVVLNGHSEKIDVGVDVLDKLKNVCEYTIYVFNSTEEYLNYLIYKFAQVK